MVHYQMLPEQVQLYYQGILLSTLFSLFLTWTDLDSGKTIGNAEECSGLYILKERHDPQEQPQMTVGSNSFSVSCQNNDSAIRSKLDPRSLKSSFLGILQIKKGENSTQEYQFWDLESFSESPITIENHIPPEPFNQPESIVDLWDKEHIQEETEERALSQQTHEAEPGPNPSKLPAWRKGVRSCTQHPIGNFISYDKLSPTFRAFTSSITDIQVPQNIQEAFKYPKWKAAVDEEVRALEKNGIRLGWSPKDSPNPMALTIRNFCSSAKLNTEEVYMDIPAGLETTSNFNKVCRLRKSLYGLKQSPRAGLNGSLREFEIKDLGNLKYFLGMEIVRVKERPDIGFSVSVVSQFMNNPTEKTHDCCDQNIEIPQDDTGKGYCSFVWGNLVTWRSKKQSVVARSSAEAEFRAMAQGICEGIWLNRLLEELRVPLKHPMVLYCDNQVAISIAKNPVHHDRTKHVEIDRHFIKEKIEGRSFQSQLHSDKLSNG
ncbi:Retrovirus-related Pol polyprotein from transposon RE1 [Vitis vinifera]|uniref:Retrovirus-related Pol polyprotein from transposon RE1 n=1 Tax=Vitis vinifera TaxID=29760 RepID=A0A438IDK2_VITVI|nr:Retrovirus-related Pol polyprotein from transposon RE1 [Vitis vinifera]